MHENRVKTFIELARQSLEEDRIGQSDFSYRHKPSTDPARAGKKSGSRSLRKKR